MRFALATVLALAAAVCAHHTSEDSSRSLFHGIHQLEGLLADADARSGEDGLWDGDAAANADAISLHSDLGPGLNLFGRARGVTPGTMRCMHPAPGADADAGIQCTSKRWGALHSTDDLLARAVLDARPTQLKDVSAADVARRPTASHLGDANVETDQEHRARRKEILGRLLRSRRRRLSAPAPVPDALVHLLAAEDAHLDGLAYARLAPRSMGGSQVVGEWEWGAVLACGRVDGLADVEVGAGERGAEVVREALPSPGLSRGAGGFRFGNGSGNGMGTDGF
ncbi:hypothetical protein DFH08DRAFT_944205 [Mycena albidolilacea]|uniref:Uncharacterized protein n=1 Tax=Mycena albidolilacea TaxID=1033008 RepID=A0AAD6Z6Q1_9AGAR|nr:hypothetical protein DFH08DRAFT_944205 [Mycena albidolilacea]